MRRTGNCRAVAMAVAAGLCGLLLPGAAQAQLTTNFWVPAGGTNDWGDTANWDTGIVPNSDTSVAILTADFTEQFAVTNLLDATLNGLVYNDTGAADAHILRIFAARGATGGGTVTFAGADPFLANHNDYNAQTYFYPTARVDGVTLRVTGAGRTLLYGPVAGNGTLLGNQQGFELFNANSNFTGAILVTNAANVDGRGGTGAGYWHFGDTNAATYLYGTAFARVMRDTVSGSNAEPFHVHGVNTAGSLRFYANSNCFYWGAVSLHTNGVISHAPWYPNDQAPIGARKDFYYYGSIVDDGNDRNLHFIFDLGTTASATGTLSRASRMVLGGEALHGGYTHVSNNRDTAGNVEWTGWLELTNGNNRLPTGSTLHLGGRMNDGGVNLGALGASGVLILAGANQELAGLQVVGTGTQNRVVGGVPTNCTLTLNIAGGTTNTYRGFLGGDGTDENNLALVKKGGGVLALTAPSNTYTGPTTVEAGTLLVNALQGGGGLITVQGGGTLGGTGTVGALGIEAGGTLAPGNSAGILTAAGAVTLAADSVFAAEINGLLAGTEYDQLAMGGNTLTISGSDLAISLGFTPSLGDSFALVTGLSGFDPGTGGTFKDKADGSNFSVGATEFQIDYSPSEITVTVVPEPHAIGLLGIALTGMVLRRRLRG